MVEQVGQTAGTGLVVAGLLVGEQQAGVLGAPLGGGQTPLRIEQNGAGVRGEHFGDQRLELFQAGVGGVLAERLLQRTALIHRGGADDTLGRGHGLQSLQFSKRKLHRIPPR